MPTRRYLVFGLPRYVAGQSVVPNVTLSVSLPMFLKLSTGLSMVAKLSTSLPMITKLSTSLAVIPIYT